MDEADEAPPKLLTIGAVGFAFEHPAECRQHPCSKLFRPHLSVFEVMGTARATLLQKVLDGVPLKSGLVLVHNNPGYPLRKISADEVAWETSGLKPSKKVA